MKTVYIETYGCQMNDYDSRRLLDLLKHTHGLTPVDAPEEADLVLLNTCSIREKAEEKVFSQLGRLRPLKEKRPGMLIGVGGCVAAQEGDNIRKRAPYVDLVFGPQTLHRLPNMINSVTQTRHAAVDVSFPEIEKFDKLPTPEAKGPTAYLSIMEGCSKYCSFCIVPYTRGEEISRNFDDVLHEAVSLAAQGVKEITLLGQNVNAYRGHMHTGETADLALVLRYLAEIEGLKRLRFMTSHPAEFSDRLIQAYAEIPQLANQLHLPVQSGSDRILQAMKRGYTAKDYISKIEKIKMHRPHISITSDFIVGFPGETDKDFQDTLALVDTIQFDDSYSFIYSKRPGTPAAFLYDDVPLEVKKERLQTLQQKLNTYGKQYSREMVGSRQMVLVTGSSERDPNILCGRTDSNRVVNLEGPVQVGDFGEADITGMSKFTLKGKML